MTASARYRAADYDELIDHPVEMGDFALAGFTAGGCRTRSPSPDGTEVDLDRLVRDLKPICSEQIALFEPRRRRAPMERYLFLTMAVGDGYGGLEHRASTALLCSRDDLPLHGMKGTTATATGPSSGLASHEYFHTWNVKRIKPAALRSLRPAAARTTPRLLWVFEGFTSLLRRPDAGAPGLIAPTPTSKPAGERCDSVLRGAGAASPERGGLELRCLDQVLPAGREHAERRGQLLREGIAGGARAST